MRKTVAATAALMVFALVLPSFGKTSKNTYPVPCSDLWGAVRDVLGDAENYDVQESSDTLMSAANYSGFEHNDSSDFRKRVEESFGKLKDAKPAEPPKPEAPGSNVEKFTELSSIL